MSFQNSNTPWWAKNKDPANMPQVIAPPEEMAHNSDSMLFNKQMSSHLMPLPEGVPWNMQKMSWGMPSPQPTLVEFTGRPPNATILPDHSALHCKRKSDLHVDIPSKHFISDEKMAAHLNGLHISPDYTTHSVSCSPMESGSPQNQSGVLFSNEELAQRLKSAQKVILCEEMKNITNESLLPSSLLQRMNEQRCMSLVLWKPPEKCLSTIEEDDDKNNNEDGNSSSSSHGQNAHSAENTMDIEM